MNKKGFVSFGLIVVITTMLIVSMTVLSMSINISDISLYKNKFNSIGYTVKSSHSFVYMKIEGYYHDSFVKACNELQTSFSTSSAEQINENLKTIQDNFKNSIKISFDNLNTWNLPMDFNHVDFADCTYEYMSYKSISIQKPVYLIIKSKFKDKNITSAYIKEYYIDLPELIETDIIRVLESDFEGVYNEHKKSLRTGREFYGY